MAILKLKSSTLMEALVASIIIFIIFVVSIEIINNIALSASSRNSFELRQEINEIKYNASTNNLELPFFTRNRNWHISVYRENGLKYLMMKNLDNQESHLKILPDANY